MRRLASLMIGCLTVGSVSWLDGQVGELQQQLNSHFTLTRVSGDRSDIVAAGTALVLQKDGLMMYSTASPLPPANTYKNGKISQGGGGFGRDFLITMATPGNGTSANYPQRKFYSREKLWVTGIIIQKDGILFHLYSDPYNDIRYYGDLKFSFEKGSVPTADQALALIANVFTVQPTEVEASGAGAASEKGAQQNSVVGRYEAQGGQYIELNSDGSFTQQIGKGVVKEGHYTLNGETLVLALTGAPAGVSFAIRGDTIYLGERPVWTRHGGPPPPPQQLKLPATFTSSQSSTDQLQLNADNSLSLQVAGQSYHGTFSLDGNTLKLAIEQIGNSTATLDGNKLTDSSRQTWVLQDKSAVPIPPAEAALRNQDIIDLVKAGIDDATILAKIASSKCQFDTSTVALINLKKSGVSAAVMKAMTEASVPPQTESRNPPAPAGAVLPASYGGFLFDGTQYQPLAPTKISVVVGLTLRAGGNGFAVDGFSGEPPQSPVAAPSQLLVYQQNVDIASVHLARLTLVRSLQAYQFNIATATVNPNPSLYPSLFGVQYNQVIPINLWRPLGQGIPVRTEPVVERNGMFRLIPDAPLPPGKYALYFGDSVHASDIVFTANGAAGTAYYFEVQAAK
jgi:hypothetical protein